MIDVAHDRDDRRTRLQRLVGIGFADKAFFDILLGNAFHRVTEFGHDELRRVRIDYVVDRQHLPLLHQELDDVDRAFGHAVGEFLNCDGFR